MEDRRSTQKSEGWARFAENLEAAFAFPKGRGAHLIRPRYPRKIAGVCAGLAEHFGGDVMLLRILAVALAVASSGLVGVAYLAGWVLIPEGQYSLPEGVPGHSGSSSL